MGFFAARAKQASIGLFFFIGDFSARATGKLLQTQGEVLRWEKESQTSFALGVSRVEKGGRLEHPSEI